MRNSPSFPVSPEPMSSGASSSSSLETRLTDPASFSSSSSWTKSFLVSAVFFLCSSVERVTPKKKSSTLWSKGFKFSNLPSRGNIRRITSLILSNLDRWKIFFDILLNSQFGSRSAPASRPKAQDAEICIQYQLNSHWDLTAVTIYNTYRSRQLSNAIWNPWFANPRR